MKIANNEKCTLSEKIYKDWSAHIFEKNISKSDSEIKNYPLGDGTWKNCFTKNS